ncbi:hypothetical protein JOF28_000159 [Leucobacter exalbidus]|uniref:Uncharacterized protein n=1 Tax=Leucobacter exalbidus TaxID=662960 RepID=A0A940PQW3_9MICO|nr:hypothetical protein [Leucobacter exalbidus]
MREYEDLVAEVGRIAVTSRCVDDALKLARIYSWQKPDFHLAMWPECLNIGQVRSSVELASELIEWNSPAETEDERDTLAFLSANRLLIMPRAVRRNYLRRGPITPLTPCGTANPLLCDPIGSTEG